MVRESARWNVEVHLLGEDQPDHEHLMQLYIQQKAAAEVEDPPPAEEPAENDVRFPSSKELETVQSNLEPTIQELKLANPPREEVEGKFEALGKVHGQLNEQFDISLLPRSVCWSCLPRCRYPMSGQSIHDASDKCLYFQFKKKRALISS